MKRIWVRMESILEEVLTRGGDVLCRGGDRGGPFQAVPKTETDWSLSLSCIQ